MDYQHFVTAPVPVRPYGPDSDAEFTAMIIVASGCVIDRRAVRMDIIVAGQEHRYSFTCAADFNAAILAVRKAGLPLSEHKVTLDVLWAINIVGLLILAVLWLLQGSIS